MHQLGDPSIDHWDFPRTVAGVALLVRFGTEQGMTADRALAGSGLTPAQLGDAATIVEAHQELRVIRNLVEVLGTAPGLGLAAGSRYHATAFGILGYAFISSRTLAEAFAIALRYLDLSSTFSIPSAALVDGRLLITLDSSTLPADVARFLVERDLAAILTVLEELLPGEITVLSLAFAFPDPPDVQPYRRILGVLPVFGAGSTVAAFDPSILDRPLPQANPHTLAMCERQCHDLVSRRRHRTGFAADVRARLTALGGLDSGMDDVARALGVSTRTLRRKLTDAGTSFQALTDEVREALAGELLATNALTIDDVANRLGYAEASSFIHAFKRWKGQTPAAYVRERAHG